ncbi:MAG: hypothetical protein ACRCZ0_10150 [Cetobacterium sp.]
MGIKMIPRIVRIASIGEASDKGFMKVCVFIDNELFWLATFGAVATQIRDGAEKGDELFLEEWNMTKKGSYFDFALTKTRILKKGGK